MTTHQPEEIFVPHHQEPPADHAVTNHIVWEAIRQINLPVTVYEYPIWLWDQYPWTNMILSNQSFWAKLGTGIRSGLGWRLIRELRCAVEIREILELKQKALSQHRSQMQPLLANSQWLTLGDLSNGEFLNCFFQNYEFFHPVKVNPATASKQLSDSTANTAARSRDGF
ncbi:PIG-L deacetylase family protein [Leptolyngbya sp. 7M]|uniref:PIG-L deacetylase family protein n=1 Tax=Leptolyngbya sp. 7M TaxID=2812896 RepID=UPI001B8B126A|nr:hypothetical protein [Leptolyngbya sp. 7M]QYO62895.1 hypothetical protein JVX88_23170 [Leptolyngbya sp. 7M]